MLIIRRLKVTGKSCCDFIFKEGLNVIEGHHSTGKTNLLEILRFSLGGNAKRVDNSVYALWEETYCEIKLNNDILTLKRKKSRTGTTIYFGEFSINDINEESIWNKLNTKEWSQKILNALQIRGSYDRGRHVKSAEISFYQLYNIIYIAQRYWGHIQQGQQIANYMDRIASFRYALDIAFLEKQELEIEQRDLEKEQEELRKKRKYYTSVLEEELNISPDNLEVEVKNLKEKIDDINKKIGSLREQEQNIWDEKLKGLRKDLQLINTEARSKEEEYNRIDEEVTSLKNFKLEIEQKLATLSFQEEAIKQISLLSFERCPNCRQELTKKETLNKCILCNQSIEETEVSFDINREIRYLQDTIDEIDSESHLLNQDMTDIETQIGAYYKKQNDTRKLISSYSNIDSIPFVDTYKNLVKERSVYDEELSRKQLHLQLWEHNRRLNEQIGELNTQIRFVENKLESLDEELSPEEKMSKFSDHYKDLLLHFPSLFENVEKVELFEDRKDNSYLPVINGNLYNEDSGFGELIVKIALYHLTFLILYQEKIAKFPPFLIIDTPKQHDLVTSVYKNLIQLFYEHSKESQIILCVSEKIHLEPEVYNRVVIKKGTFTLNKCNE